MLLGYCTRPPYWKVLLRFCSQALAMAVHQERQLISTWKFQTRWVWHVGLLVVCLPWYCIVGLVQASCRNLNRKGFMTSEQRWKAVRMYNSLHPLWQLSLHKKILWQHRFRAGPGLIVLILHSVKNAEEVLRFGTGISCHLLHDLAVRFILHEPVVTT